VETRAQIFLDGKQDGQNLMENRRENSVFLASFAALGKMTESVFGRMIQH
jgi:hypothetical protein